MAAGAVHSLCRFMWLLLATLMPLFHRMLRTKLGWLVLGVLFIYSGARDCGRRDALRLGSFNIRDFGPSTDLGRLTALLGEVDPQVMALQEIKRPDLLPQVAIQLSERTGRHYQTVVSQCGGKRSSHVGYLYDAERVHLEKTQEFPELRQDNGGSCSAGARAGLLGVFSVRRWLRRQRYALLVVHFPAGGGLEQIRERQAFWARALSIAEQTRQRGEERVLVLGDVNSTGYRDDVHGERRDIHRTVEQAGFQVLTPDLGCTEYYQPEPLGMFRPSHLDHIIGSTAAVPAGNARTYGFCETLRCAPAARMPADYQYVSDHCPITVEVR